MHSQSKPGSDYLSYMLRLWHKRDSNGKQVWCASLEEPGSHLIERFEDSSALFAYLQSKLGIEEPNESAQREQ